MKKGSIGAIHKCTLRGMEAACKVIQNERINSFIIEGFLEGICKIK
jgi:hypothetical protein